MAVVIVIIYLFVHHRPIRQEIKATTTPANGSQTPSTSNLTPKNGGSSSTSSGQTPQSNTIPSSTDKLPSSSPSTSQPLKAPSGTFVSNHRPSLSGSSSQEQSVCNTTPGANCYIQFTKGNLVKTLPVQTVGSSGSVYWNWDVQSAGFSPGPWQITAIASANGQTLTTQDSQPLEVQP